MYLSIYNGFIFMGFKFNVKFNTVLIGSFISKPVGTDKY